MVSIFKIAHNCTVKCSKNTKYLINEIIELSIYVDLCMFHLAITINASASKKDDLLIERSQIRILFFTIMECTFRKSYQCNIDTKRFIHLIMSTFTALKDSFNSRIFFKPL